MIDFVLAGAPKCGTTSIGAGLSRVEGLCMSVPKETFHFNPEFRTRHVKRTAAEYRDLFLRPGLRGDGSVWSMYSPTFPTTLLKTAPEAKVVLSLRSPERVVTSLFHYNQDKGYENASDLRTAFALDTQSPAARRRPKACPEPIYLQYRLVADITQPVQKILQYLPEDRVLIFDFDMSNKESIVPAICDFLGVDQTAASVLPYDNPTSYSPPSTRYETIRFAARTMRAVRRISPLGLPATGVLDRYRRTSRARSQSIVDASRAAARDVLADEIASYDGLMRRHAQDLGAPGLS